MIDKNFEKRLMRMILAGNEKTLETLREQYAIARIKSVESSDVGFFIRFLIRNQKNLNINNKSFEIGDVDGNINGIRGALGFILYVKDGFIEALEGYTNVVDKWPKSNQKITLTYDSGEERNIEKLKSKWL